MRPERRRRLSEYSMWTFVAPVALVVAVVIVVSVVSGAVQRSRSTSSGKSSPAATSTTTPIVSTGPGKKAYYRVRPGDTLATIAARLGVDVDTLYQLNPNIDEFNLQPGQRLRVG